jgi:hypothetical protein
LHVVNERKVNQKRVAAERIIDLMVVVPWGAL